jgi:hypothetical protein
MRIPMKVDYGVRALVDLAQQADAGRPVRTAEIAQRQNIPEPYLDQVLTTLNKFGFIRSRRGPQGGHVLGRVDTPYKELAAQARYPVQHIGPEVNPARIGGGRFEVLGLEVQHGDQIIKRIRHEVPSFVGWD